MKTKIIILAAIIINTQIANAQIMFQNHYGGTEDDGGSCVIQTDDHGYIIAAQTFSFGTGTSDIYIIKTDEFGNEIWTKTYGGNGWDAPFQIKETNDNNYIIVGRTSSYGFGGSDAFLMKIDIYGDSLWFKTYGGVDDDGAYAIDNCEDGGFIFAGYTNSFTSDCQTEAYLLKTDSIGDLLWTKTFCKNSFNSVFDIIKTTNDNYFLTGITQGSLPSEADGLVIKTNNNGDTVWMRTYGGSSYDSFSSICEDSNGDIILCGTTYSFGGGNYDGYFIKINTNGGLIWSKTIGGMNEDNTSSIAYTSDNSFIIAGSTQSYGAGGKDVVLLKVNQTGDTLWSKLFGGISDDVAGCVHQTDDNGFIITGYTKSYNANSEVYLIKTDASGFLGFEKIISVSENLIIFPNPSRGLFNLKIPENIIDNPEIEVYNTQGQRIFKKQFSGTRTDLVEIDISNKPKGIYIICVKGEYYYKTSKIIIN